MYVYIYIHTYMYIYINVNIHTQIRKIYVLSSAIFSRTVFNFISELNPDMPIFMNV
jgi:hypothetical protein